MGQVNNIIVRSSNTTVIAASNSVNAGTADIVCTGTSDEVTINAAITALPAAGGKIILRAGLYSLGSGPIIIDKDYVTIEGENATMWGGYTQSYVVGQATGTEGVGCAKIKVTTTGLSAIEFQNANAGGTGSDTNRHRGIRVANLYLFGFTTAGSGTGTALRTNYGTSAGSGDDLVVIEGCFIQRFNIGMTLLMDSPLIRGNSIQDCAGDGIQLVGGVYGQVINNLIYDIGGSGVFCTARGAVISCNTIGDCLSSGVVTQSSAIVVANNVLRVCKSHVILLNNTSNSCVVNANTIDQSGSTQSGSPSASTDGIRIAPSGTASNNSITGNALIGVAANTGYAINALYNQANTNTIVGNSITGVWNNSLTNKIMEGYGNTVGLNGGHTQVVLPAGPATVTTAQMVAWFKADTLGLSNGATVVTFPDSSGYTFTLTSAGSPTYNTTGINSKGVVSLNGTSQYLTNTTMPPIAQVMTVFVVAQSSASGATRTMMNSGVGSSTTNALFLNSTAKPSIFANSSLNAAATAAAAAPHIFEAQFNGSSSLVGADGVFTTGNPGTNGAGAGLVIGASQTVNSEFFNGLIGEVVIYVGPMSTADRSSVRVALGTKWNVTVTP